ncbi:DNA-3-methyladenine glycosylase [Candidatus Bathyarchaeota archaeon]|nr:DNA-3-methyladenine glycosylase [Candidatus Bathyarchaeota archaeon]
MKVLPKDFYERDPALVAKELLGKILVRRLGSEVLSGKIVETEAYYGKNDPASRAYTGRKIFNELMFLDVGKAFIYMVHANWLLNIVAHLKNDVGAVLIRAIEPLEGIEIMRKNRKVEDIRNLTSGPGKLTKALAITKEQNGIDVTEISSELTIAEGKMESFEIETSHRIGVKNDLPRELRFFVKGNKFVSKFS